MWNLVTNFEKNRTFVNKRRCEAPRFKSEKNFEKIEKNKNFYFWKFLEMSTSKCCTEVTIGYFWMRFFGINRKTCQVSKVLWWGIDTRYRYYQIAIDTFAIINQDILTGINTVREWMFAKKVFLNGTSNLTKNNLHQASKKTNFIYFPNS